MRRAANILAVAALIGSTAIVIRAMEVNIFSTVAVTVHTTDGESFRMTGRVELQGSGAPDTVTVEIWKDGSKGTYRIPPAPPDTAYGQQYLRLGKGARFVPDAK